VDARSHGLDRLDVPDVDDRRRSRARVGELGWAELGLAHELRRQPVGRAVQCLHIADADERCTEPREARALVVDAWAEREDVEVVQRMQRVVAPAREEEDAVPLANLERLALVPGQAAAAENVEELLLDAVVVRRSRPAAGRNPDPAGTDADRPGGMAD
jgi:hypothetical protein